MTGTGKHPGASLAMNETVFSFRTWRVLGRAESFELLWSELKGLDFPTSGPASHKRDWTASKHFEMGSFEALTVLSQLGVGAQACRETSGESISRRKTQPSWATGIG